MDTENRLTAVRGEGLRGWVRRVKGLDNEKKRLMDTDNCMVNTSGKGGGGGSKRVKGG